MPRSTSGESLLKRLKAGNRRFVEGRSVHPRQTPWRVHSQAKGQKPFVTVLGCSDSRVPVEEVFDMGVGDIFACRVAGNIATTEIIASIEYSITSLGVGLVVVMGHAECGAIHAALTGAAHPGFVESLVNNLEVALEVGGPGATPDTVGRVNVTAQMKRIQRSAIVQAARTLVVGAHYDIDTGRVHFT